MRSSGNAFLKAFHILGGGVAILLGCLVISTSALAASGGANVLFILDGSGSMWGAIG